MRVLITGASGFLGRRIAEALREAGDDVVRAVRHRRDDETDTVRVDFAHDTAPEVWLPRLAGIEVVVNAVGIFREHGAQRFDTLHTRTPSALFEACARAGVRRVVQISALGADEHAATAFHASKRAADERLLALPPSAAVVQPSLVYGPGGTSARWFETMASLPLIALPAGGRQQVQPVHVDDAVEAIVALVHADEPRGRIALVGPRPVRLRDMLAALRAGMGLGRARFVPIPRAVMALVARAGDRLPASPIDRSSWQMLERGNTADAGPVTRLLGRPPRPVERFIAPARACAVRGQALLGWLLPLLRWTIALMWIVTGIVSLWVYPVSGSMALLEGAGVPAPLRLPALWSAGLLDIALGVAILVWRRRVVWLAQIALVLVYTAIITVKLPEFWAHPYGPVLKNLPLLAAMLLLHQFERR